MNKALNKKIDIEIIRIMACFLVIFNHTQSNGFLLFKDAIPFTFKFYLYSFVSIFCKVAVPLFLGISGANLLKKDETLKELFQKRILKIINTLFVFSLISYLIFIAINKQSFDIFNFLRQFYHFPSYNYAYWYLYAYVGFLLLIPLTRGIVKNLKNEHYIYNYYFCINK